MMNGNFEKIEYQSGAGLCGVIGPADASALALTGLQSLYRRGGDQWALIGFNIDRYNPSDTLPSETWFKAPCEGTGTLTRMLHTGPSNIAAGHVRRDGSVISIPYNTSPFYDMLPEITYIAADGNITDAMALRSYFMELGRTMQGRTPGDLLAFAIASAKGSLVERIQDVCQNGVGPFKDILSSAAFVLLGNNFLAYGRGLSKRAPLCIGKLQEGYMIASETCALDNAQAYDIRDVTGGEVGFFRFHKGTIQHTFWSMSGDVNSSPCIMEFMSRAQGQSRMDGINITDLRRVVGSSLIDLVSSVPQPAIIGPLPYSGNEVARGLSDATGIRYVEPVMRNNVRLDGQRDKEELIRHKYPINIGLARGNNIILVLDSMRTGGTLQVVARGLKSAGALSVHVVMPTTPVQYRCPYGKHSYPEARLVGSTVPREELARHFGVDSFTSLDLRVLKGVFKAHGLKDVCSTCIDEGI